MGELLITIGAVAKQAGVAASALRYYERRGLVTPAGRRGGRRVYEASVVERIALIRLCRDTGFTLAEIRQLLAGRNGFRRAWTALARQKVRELEGRIEEARSAKKLLEHALACPKPDLLTCPNFQASLRARLPPGQEP